MSTAVAEASKTVLDIKVFTAKRITQLRKTQYWTVLLAIQSNIEKKENEDGPDKWTLQTLIKDPKMLYKNLSGPIYSDYLLYIKDPTGDFKMDDTVNWPYANLTSSKKKKSSNNAKNKKEQNEEDEKEDIIDIDPDSDDNDVVLKMVKQTMSPEEKTLNRLLKLSHNGWACNTQIGSANKQMIYVYLHMAHGFDKCSKKMMIDFLKRVGEYRSDGSVLAFREKTYGKIICRDTDGVFINTGRLVATDELVNGEVKRVMRKQNDPNYTALMNAVVMNIPSEELNRYKKAIDQTRNQVLNECHLTTRKVFNDCHCLGDDSVNACGQVKILLDDAIQLSKRGIPIDPCQFLYDVAACIDRNCYIAASSDDIMSHHGTGFADQNHNRSNPAVDEAENMSQDEMSQDEDDNASQK